MQFLGKRHKDDKDLLETPNLRVSNSRLKSEDNFFRQLIPELYSKYKCNIEGILHDPGRRRYMDEFYSKSKPPLFTNVQIETINRCNGTCSFCPVNRDLDPRSTTFMSEELFGSFVGQLSALNYDKTFGFFSNNEPFLDKRLPEFMQEARQQMPQAQVTTVTNGTLLTTDLFRKIMPHLNTIVINDYNQELGLHDNIKEIREYCLTPEGKKQIDGKKVIIEMRNPHVVLGSRGSSAKNRKPVSSPLKASCICLFKQFIVRPDGCISLCCNDALGQVTLGDLKTESIEEIWQGQRFEEARTAMMEKGRAGIPLCAGCDFPGLKGK